MNELQIFNSSEFGQIRTVIINGKTEYLVNGTMIDRFKLLAMAYDEDNKEKAMELLNVASIIFHPQDDEVFNTLYGTVAMAIAQNFSKKRVLLSKIV